MRIVTQARSRRRMQLSRSKRRKRLAAPRTGRAEAASTRERILNVALDLFTEKGFDGTSLREIAEDWV